MSRWPVAGPSEYWRLASSPASKVKTAIHTQYNKYTSDDNNTHKTTTTCTRQLTTIHTIQQTTIHTTHLKIQHVQKVNNITVRKYCIQFLVFFPTHTVLTLSPQPFTSHHFTTHTNFSHKVSPYTSLHFTTLLDDFHFILLRFSTLLDGLQHTLSSFNSARLSLSYPLLKNNWFAGESV